MKNSSHVYDFEDALMKLCDAVKSKSIGHTKRMIELDRDLEKYRICNPGMEISFFCGLISLVFAGMYLFARLGYTTQVSPLKPLWLIILLGCLSLGCFMYWLHRCRLVGRREAEIDADQVTFYKKIHGDILEHMFPCKELEEAYHINALRKGIEAMTLCRYQILFESKPFTHDMTVDPFVTERKQLDGLLGICFELRLFELNEDMWKMNSPLPGHKDLLYSVKQLLQVRLQQMLMEPRAEK